ncbi:MAG: hypothetical protein J6Y83_01245, partial [Bacteroidales bacterium]|nr:hypothetical protein [Bacteroidales bacterium]
MGVKSSIEKIYVRNYKIKLQIIIRENNLEMFTFLEQNFPQIGKELIDKYIYKINILLSSEYKLWSDLLVEEKSLIKREEYENFKSRDISFYEKKKIIGVLNKRNLTMEQILELEYIVREYLTDCRKRNEILDSINKELRVTPNNIGLIKSKEKILKTLNANSKEMLEDYTRFLEQSPGNKEIREKRARVFLKIGDYKLAVREYKMLGEDIDINTKKDMIEALAKSGNIKEAVHEYIPILKAPKCTLKDVKSALYLLMQQKEIDKETILFFRELLDQKDKQEGKVIPSKMKFIYNFFKKKKLDEFKTLKLICLKTDRELFVAYIASRNKTNGGKRNEKNCCNLHRSRDDCHGLQRAAGKWKPTAAQRRSGAGNRQLRNRRPVHQVVSAAGHQLIRAVRHRPARESLL